MTKEGKTDLVVNMTDTLWQVNKYKFLDHIEQMSGVPVPEDLYKLVETAFRTGAAVMERTIGGAR